MKRIMIMGVSAGVGKSTFARKLGDILQIDVYHLDAYYWKPGWVEVTEDEFRGAQEEVVKKDQWIIEGNYTSTYDIRASRADTIIYLELPLVVCLGRVLKRFFKNIGRTRPDMGKGCKEKIDWQFIKFIITTYYPRKNKMVDRFKAFQSADAERKVIMLKNKRAIKDYLQESTLKYSSKKEIFPEKFIE
ncbi:topology modulation protein [Heyndrickxia sporothermodurans]|uniref:topology modulation protein n=1 Tax=Heyndrickxia sporothermodurans TaxID=46224 RepID=UPI002DB55EAC|nr:topology modulation protein [Heyndrickxia sporothermodurans]MEB6550443.1 topology modulation protein [Heyndrickxia sporothermodurans]